jgi:lipoprotein-releasing system permease protein
LVKLSEGAYFVREVPVAWPWGSFLLINLGVAGVCLLSMLLPTLAISRIRPVKALQLG